MRTSAWRNANRSMRPGTSTTMPSRIASCERVADLGRARSCRARPAARRRTRGPRPRRRRARARPRIEPGEPPPDQRLDAARHGWSTSPDAGSSSRSSARSLHAVQRLLDVERVAGGALAQAAHQVARGRAPGRTRRRAPPSRPRSSPCDVERAGRSARGGSPRAPRPRRSSSSGSSSRSVQTSITGTRPDEPHEVAQQPQRRHVGPVDVVEDRRAAAPGPPSPPTSITAASNSW